MPEKYPRLPNETQADYDARVNPLILAESPNTLTSDDIKPEPTITPIEPQDPTIPSVDSLNAEIEKTFESTKSESSAQGLIDRLTSELNPQLVGESAYRTKEEESQGVPALLKTQQDLSGQLTQLQAEAKAIPIQIQKEAEGRGITAGGAAPLERGRLRDNAIKALYVSSTLEATRGNISLALDLVDRAVKAKYDPIREEIVAAKANLDLIINSPEYTNAEKKRAAQQKALQDEKERVLNTQADEQKQIWGIATTAAQNGADALTIRNIQNATTKEEALRIASEAGALGAESLDTQVIEVNGQKMLIDTRTGDIIQSYGTPTSFVEPGENPQLYSGLSSTTATAVRAKVNSFKTEPTAQNFATIQEGFNFARSISNTTTNPADDQALIYSLAKALDPGSVVREGEYATAQKYAQSWVQAYGKSITQALFGTGFLSERARENIKSTIEQKYNSSKTTYQNVYDRYISGINQLTGRGDGNKFLVDYALPELESEEPGVDQLPPIDGGGATQYQSSGLSNLDFFGNLVQGLPNVLQ